MCIHMKYKWTHMAGSEHLTLRLLKCWWLASFLLIESRNSWSVTVPTIKHASSRRARMPIRGASTRSQIILLLKYSTCTHRRSNLMHKKLSIKSLIAQKLVERQLEMWIAIQKFLYVMLHWTLLTCCQAMPSLWYSSCSCLSTSSINSCWSFSLQ